MIKKSLISLLCSVALFACDNNEKLNNEPVTSTAVQPIMTWVDIQQERKNALENYLQDQQTAYRWFADFPLGINDGVPYLILKTLPALAPEQWGSEENFLDVIGLFKDERLANYPIARGFGWSGLARDTDEHVVDYASFTCGACHVGRVETEQGYTYLDGGVNAEFNLPQYRVRAMNTVNKIIAGATTPEAQISQATQAILAAIDTLHKADPTYFYQNYQLGDKHFNAAYEAEQIALFKQNAPAIIAKFIGRTTLEYKAFGALLDKNYHGFEAQMLKGFGGMADATGVSTSFGYIVNRDVEKNPHVTPENGLPPTQGITDFMVVWEQGKRKVSWSEDKTQLVKGGGQWNGNIPIPMFRNLAAELTMGFGAETDIRVAAFAEILLENLPAPVYPFDVDLTLAAQGKPLFEQNCAGCHQPHNGQVYKNLNTDNSRAFIANEGITTVARSFFTGVCSPTTVAKMPSGNVTPCAEFEGVSLENNAEFAMMDPKAHEGYNALPLGGIWAQAPYLHNGSVPTLYHLLMPKERPETFVKSRLSYDQKLVGFEWQVDAALDAKSTHAYRFDTKAIKAFSNKGHDTDISENGVTYKLDWSNDKAGAMALIEYMKTL